MFIPLDDQSFMNEIEADMIRWRTARDQAEELVRGHGWSEADDDFCFQVEEEAKRQWDEGWERDHRWRWYGEEDDEQRFSVDAEI
jgi:hypothetical protein